MEKTADNKLRGDLIFAHLERMAGYKGLSGDEVADRMDAIIDEMDNNGKRSVSLTHL